MLPKGVVIKAAWLVCGPAAFFLGASRPAAAVGLEAIQQASFGGFNVNFGPRDHVASKFVDLSMLTEDGKVRR